MTKNTNHTDEMLELEASCHNTWKDVILLSVGSIAFLFSGFFPYLALVAVICLLLFVFTM